MIPNELSADAAAIVDRLQEVPHGGTITHGEISAVIGRDIRNCRHILYAALRVVQREHGVIFAGLRGVGYERMTTERVVEVVGPDTRRAIRRKARRGVKALVAATKGPNSLTPEQQRKASTEIGVLGLIEHLSRDRHAKPAPEASLKPEPVAVVARRLLDELSK